MKKAVGYILLTIAVLLGQALAFTNGSAASWSAGTALPGAVFAGYTPVGSARITKNNDADSTLGSPQVDVLTMKIATINVSANYVAKNETVTISYLVTNTGLSTATISNAGLNFFQTTISGALSNAHFAVTRLAPAGGGSYTLAPGASTWNVFSVQVNANRPNGAFLVDGVLSGTAGDASWTAPAILSGATQTGAVSINYLYSTSVTLDLAAQIDVVSPNGAVDKIISSGQDFVISFNVRSIGDDRATGDLTARIDWLGTPYLVSYNIGQTVTYNLSAVAAAANYPLIVALAGSPLNESSMAPVKLANGTANTTITVVSPAQLQILDAEVSTKQVAAYQILPAVVTVNVKNSGGAGATLNPSAADLGFIVGGVDNTGTYLVTAPAPAYIAANTDSKLVYTISRFGGGLGIATVNVTLNAYDENSSWPISASKADTVTYNVTYNAGLAIEQLRVTPNLVKYQQTFAVVVPVRRTVAQKINIDFNAQDDLRILNSLGQDITVSFNFVSVTPVRLNLMDDNVHYVTYNVTPVDALGGICSVNVAPNQPSANAELGGLAINASPVNGGLPATFNYDPAPPLLVSASYDTLTAPTNNFILLLEFSETMNALTTPGLSTTPAVNILNGSWLNGAVYRAALDVLAVSGWVTVNLTGQATDLAGNPVVASPNFAVFYVAPKLTLSEIEIVSPNGALDALLSHGQDFWISFNVQNIGASSGTGLLQVTVNWQDQELVVPVTVGVPITLSLTASPHYAEQYVTVSIITPALPALFDRVTDDLKLTIVTPAALTVDAITLNPPTTDVLAYQNGPVTVAVQVTNTGGAGATLNAQTTDLKFLFNNLPNAAGYALETPDSEIYIGAGGTQTINYIIKTFGAPAGLCTLNVLLNAYDENSGWLITASAAEDKTVTYNVTINASISIEEMVVLPAPFNQREIQVVVRLKGLIGPGETLQVTPGLNDLFITGPDGNPAAVASFNLLSARPAPDFLIVDNITEYFITYNLAPIYGAAVEGVHLFGLNPNAPTASFVGLGIPALSGGNSFVTANYDPVSPNLLAATANINNPAVLLTAPTDNFYLTLEFNETMDVSTAPVVSFNLNGPAPVFVTGSWSDSSGISRNVFASAAMHLVSANEGWVTIDLLAAGARDLAGNTAAASANISVFYVDATAPGGTIEILDDNNDRITTASVVTLDILTWTDNYSLSPNMEFMLVSPDSQVSTDAGVSLNEWLPYQRYLQGITLNLAAETLGTKNIYVRLRDEAGNVSALVSSSIVFDADEVFWLRPVTNNIVSGDVLLEVRTSLLATTVNFLASVNNTLYPIASDIPVDPATGTSNVLWPSAGWGWTTDNVELLAVVYKGAAVSTGNVFPIVVDNTPPAVSLNGVWPLYAYNSVTLSGTATDNMLITAVDHVAVSIERQSVLVATADVSVNAAGDWEYYWTMPAADPYPTTYDVTVKAYDLAGNVSASAAQQLVKIDALPQITLLAPTPGIWLDNTFDFTGTAYSLFELEKVQITLLSAAGGGLVLTSNLAAVGTANWRVTFDLPEADVLAATPYAATLSVTAFTVVFFGQQLSLSEEFSYRIDGITPNLITINIVNGQHAVGTLNVAGVYQDDHSGVSAVLVSRNNVVTTLNVASGSFNYVLAVTSNAADMTIAFAALDTAYPSPNMSPWSVYTVVQDFALLPTAAITAPVSPNYYVNNTMQITGTALVSPNGASVAGVWLRFTSETGATSEWLTANYTPSPNNGAVTWQCAWRVPSADAHGTTYNVEARILSSTGMLAEVSPNALMEYTKDSYGPQVSFLNMVDGMYLIPPGAFGVNALTRAEGAPVSATYFVVNGVPYAMNFSSMLSSANNLVWEYPWDFAALTGSQHVLSVISVDTVGNRAESTTLTVSTVPSVIITEPLPPGGIISADILAQPIYATSLNQVLFKLDSYTASTALHAYVSFVRQNGATVTVAPQDLGGGLFSVTLNPLAPTPDEGIVHLLNIIETNGTAVTVHYQPVVYDRTPPTVNAVFGGLVRYYPGAGIAPNETFVLNLIDRTPSGERGSGFSRTPVFDVVTGSTAPTPDPALRSAGSIQRSVLWGGAATNNNILTSAYDPLTEELQFTVKLSAGAYDLSIDAVDNAGNALTVTFNVYGLLVNQNVTGESGTLDKSKFITTYPNPYDPGRGDVLFTYYLKDNAQRARIMVYNQIGELLHLISVDGPGRAGTSAGYNQVAWDGLDKFERELSNGVYIYLIVIDGDRGQTFTKGIMAVLRK